MGETVASGPASVAERMPAGTRDLGEVDVVTPSEAVAESWANGLGVTRVLATRLAWRLSIADLRGRMSFSSYPGVERVLIPLTAPSVVLTVDGVDHRVTRERGIRFAGEARVVASAERGGLSVLNLMVKRGLAAPTHRIDLVRGGTVVDTSTTLAVLLAGTATVDGLPLPPGSALLPSSRPRTVVGESALLARFDIVPAGSDAPL